MGTSKIQIDTWIAAAKLGNVEALGQLLHAYSSYLKTLADDQLDWRLRRRLNASDIVQETLLEAFRDFHFFKGQFANELRSWLRRILIHNLMNATEKHLIAQKRDARHELSFLEIRSLAEQSSVRFDWLFVDLSKSPSSLVCDEEKRGFLYSAIAALPLDYKQVIVLRHLDGLEFSAIADRMNKSSGACRMLWLRAIERLKSDLLAFSEDGET
jgi:RNA polymerase sigma-70 factor (ECF subfamily)